MHQGRATLALCVITSIVMLLFTSCSRREPPPWAGLTLPPARYADRQAKHIHPDTPLVIIGRSNIVSFTVVGGTLSNMAREVVGDASKWRAFIAADADTDSTVLFDAITTCHSNGIEVACFLTSLKDSPNGIGLIYCFHPDSWQKYMLYPNPSGDSMFLKTPIQGEDKTGITICHVIHISMNEIMLNGKISNMANVDKHLRNLSEINKRATILVLAGGKVSLGRIIEVMDICCKNHLGNFSLVEESKIPQSSNSPPSDAVIPTNAVSNVIEV